jgi:hypothetical protein
MSLLVFGNSMLIIKVMIVVSSPVGNKLKSIAYRINCVLSHLKKVSFYHIKRALNGEAYHWDNIVSSLSLGSLVTNNGFIYCLIT